MSTPTVLSSHQRSSTAHARVCRADVEFSPQRLAVPLQLSSGTIVELTQATATVEVEVGAAQRRAVGRGAIYLSDLWAWPDPKLTHERRDANLREACRLAAQELPLLTRETALHPTEIGLRLHDWVCAEARFADSPPLLARAMAASPFDAALHDAVGSALGCSAFRLYDEPHAIPTADPFFPSGGACRAIARTIQSPRRELSAWWIVNKSDRLDQSVAEAVRRSGYACFKLKITGADVDADVARTAEVYRAVRAMGLAAPRLTVDSNEANPDAASVVEYLVRLQSLDAEAYAALEYLEQPTARDITQAAFDWRIATSKKPVLLDEGLTGLEILDAAQEQGWSGFALKTCKGHSMLMATAAWAHEHDLLLALQDLTNPGIALVHGALVGAHLPTMNGAELNSPQFTPAANEAFLSRHKELFEPCDGRHRLPKRMPLGLGATVQESFA